jgi:DNA-3-methyladenine glycosylase I
MLNLEGAQAGLSWETILKKRENYRVAFDNWDPEIISKYDQTKIEELLQNPGIVRNRLKVNAVVTNANAYLSLKDEFGGLDNYLWSQVPGRIPIRSNGRERIITSPLSDTISKDLKKRNFKFVGSTIMYAYLQAVGIVNDHDLNCDWRNPDHSE